jgi:hypothetical protein
MEPWPVYPFWQILSSAGDGWKVEKMPNNADLCLTLHPKERADQVLVQPF